MRLGLTGRPLARAVLVLQVVLHGLSCAHYQSSTESYQGLPAYRGAGPLRTAEARESRDYDSPPTKPFSNSFFLIWPTEPVRINRGFRPASDPDHQGLDLGGYKNQRIRAAHAGRVIYAGRDFRGYGNMILIEGSRGWSSLYGHLNEFAIKTGEVVEAGQLIGYMGRTGRASGVHLHFELLHKKIPVDPLVYLSAPDRIRNSTSSARKTLGRKKI